MDYKRVGLTAGIEIHQQLDTREKLFCRCPTTLRETGDHTGEFHRYLRATESEMGEIDRAAQEEMKRDRMFCYYTYDTTCLVENDEEPPAPLNEEALSVCLTIAKMFSMTPVPQVHTMRKLVIDGSNTSGFQRTALIAVNGILPNSGQIETICLEEEAAQRVKDETFSLDRLGIPLVEITTSPCMHTPDEVQPGWSGGGRRPGGARDSRQGQPLPHASGWEGELQSHEADPGYGTLPGGREADPPGAAERRAGAAGARTVRARRQGRRAERGGGPAGRQSRAVGPGPFRTGDGPRRTPGRTAGCASRRRSAGPPDRQAETAA